MSIASHRRLWWLVSATLLLVLALSLVRTGLASGAPRRPPTPANLPVAIEGLTRHTPQTSCDPTTKPGTLKLARLLTSTYTATRYGTVRDCGPTPSSEHQEGRAVDWMASVRSPGAPRRGAGRARLAAGHRPRAERVRDGPPARRDVPDLEQPDLEHRPGRRGLATLLRLRQTSRAFGRQPVPPRHLHISLSWEGARGVTSYWTGRVARADFGPCRVVGLNWAAPFSGFNPRPCTRYPTVTAPAGASPTLRTLTTYSGRVLKEGTTGVAVKSLQKVVGVTATGTFGPATKRALQPWQGDHGLTRTGIVGGVTWRVLLSSQAP